MKRPTSSRVWKLAKAPTASLHEDTFVLCTEPIPSPDELRPGEVLVATQWLSNDPSQRALIQRGQPQERMYTRVVPEGAVMSAYGIGRVVESRSPKFQPGALVIGSMGWREYAVLSDAEIRPAPDLPSYPPTIALGALGGPALAAWFGLYDVCRVRPEHVVLISGAAGATGSAAVQIAKKIVGARRVVGIAGGPEKCAWVCALGADACVDYKAPGFEQALREATGGDVDAYMDLVGGETLDIILRLMKRHGSIAVCGSISSYNDNSVSTLNNWHEVIVMRLNLRGYIVLDYVEQWPVALAALGQAVQDGRYLVRGAETVREVPFERVPEVWQGLFTGANRGKLITKLISSSESDSCARL